MQILGILLLVAGAVCIFMAFRKGGEKGTGVTDGPPPPKSARALMATGVGCLLLGLVLMLVL